MEGRDDVFVLSWLILTIFLLERGIISWSAVTLALACSSKHTAWFFVPFYFIYVHFFIKQKNVKIEIGEYLKNFIKLIWPFPTLFLLLILPFVIWDPISFFQDIYAYPAGTIPTSYPISGYGLSVVFYQLGLIKNITDYFPFWIAQIPITIIFYYFLIKNYGNSQNMSHLVFCYGALIFIYLFLSRFFHDNYIGFISQIFIVSYFLIDDKIISVSK
ncbi:hypothetical protein GYA54_04030 [Candidatus Kuenenbacteria bacterium]|nr:hypothetical protein [Candidatus Kuenenbacteria bacterium]